MRTLCFTTAITFYACTSPYLQREVETACNEASTERNEIAILGFQAGMASDSNAKRQDLDEIERRRIVMARKQSRCDSLLKKHGKSGLVWPKLAEPPPGKEDPFRGL